MTWGASPCVTVFIPVYNRAEYVAAAIDSILQQTFADFELLVIDDGSVDETVSVVQGYDDPRLQLIRHKVNWGQARTRNHGLELARGRFLALLDSDDIAVADRLERQVSYLERHPQIGEVGGWIQSIDPQGARGKSKHLPTAPRELRAQLPWRSGVAHTTVMVRAELAKRLGYDERFQQAHDYDFHARLSAIHEMANLGSVLTYKRVHSDQLSRETTVAHSYKKQVMRRLIGQLGVEPSAGALDKHFALTRIRTMEVEFDWKYLRWARVWLQRLTKENARRAIFPEPEFSQFACYVWRRLCVTGLRWAPGSAIRGLTIASPRFPK